MCGDVACNSYVHDDRSGSLNAHAADVCPAPLSKADDVPRPILGRVVLALVTHAWNAYARMHAVQHASSRIMTPSSGGGRTTGAANRLPHHAWHYGTQTDIPGRHWKLNVPYDTNTPDDHTVQRMQQFTQGVPPTTLTDAALLLLRNSTLLSTARAGRIQPQPSRSREQYRSGPPTHHH